MRPTFRWSAVDGEPIRAGDVTVTPRSRTLTVTAGPVGFAWQRPTSILVERGGQTERHTIVDVTFIAQVALLVLAALFAARSKS
jgi:hypothetical protein